jgi:hypothetical protein
MPRWDAESPDLQSDSSNIGARSGIALPLLARTGGTVLSCSYAKVFPGDVNFKTTRSGRGQARKFIGADHTVMRSRPGGFINRSTARRTAGMQVWRGCLGTLSRLTCRRFARRVFYSYTLYRMHRSPPDMYKLPVASGFCVRDAIRRPTMT